MKWEEFCGTQKDKSYEKTDIECPECGCCLLRYVRVVLTTYPAKYRYDCPKCGWRGVK